MKPDRIDWKKSYWTEAEKCGLLEQQLAELKAARDNLRFDYEFKAGQLFDAEAENERLSAHNAMLVEAISSFKAEIGYEWLRPEFNPMRDALNATAQSIQQWKEKFAAEVGRNALIDAAHYFNHSGASIVEHRTVAAELRRMADEAK